MKAYITPQIKTRKSALHLRLMSPSNTQNGGSLRVNERNDDNDIDDFGLTWE